MLRSFNLNYLSKEKNYGVILMGVILHLVMSRLCLSGKLRILGLWLGSLARFNLILFSIWGLIKLLLICGMISTQFTIKTTLLGIFNWSMRWLISHKEVSQLRNIFSGFQTLWVDYSDIVYANVPVEALSAIQTVHVTSKWDQFLMKLRPDFEIARSNMMNHHPVPSLDACLSDLLREEQRIIT